MALHLEKSLLSKSYASILHNASRRLALEQEDIEFRIALARRLVKEGSETIEGKKAYSRKAIRMAEELKRKKQVCQQSGQCC